MQNDAVKTINEKLLPLATIVTPNLPEAEVIIGQRIVTDQEMIEAAKKLQDLGTKNVVVKGGHSQNKEAADFAFTSIRRKLLDERSESRDRQYSWNRRYLFRLVSLLSWLKGKDLKEAIIIGKKFIQAAISQPNFRWAWSRANESLGRDF